MERQVKPPKPKGPSTAYNIYFKEEFKRAKEEQGGVVSAQVIMAVVADRWNQLPEQSKSWYRRLQARDRVRYAEELVKWEDAHSNDHQYQTDPPRDSVSSGRRCAPNQPMNGQYYSPDLKYSFCPVNQNETYATFETINPQQYEQSHSMGDSTAWFPPPNATNSGDTEDPNRRPATAQPAKEVRNQYPSDWESGATSPDPLQHPERIRQLSTALGEEGVTFLIRAFLNGHN